MVVLVDIRLVVGGAGFSVWSRGIGEWLFRGGEFKCSGPNVLLHS